MSVLEFWPEAAAERIPVETTLKDMGYDDKYIGIVKKIFRINQTPFSGMTPSQFMLKDAFCHAESVSKATQLAFTHTGQEVYPFGQSSLIKLNRASHGIGSLQGATACNCVSTFKLLQLNTRQRNRQKQVIFTCDTGFSGILKDIPSSTVTGDARSALCIDETQGKFTIQSVMTHHYPEHFGGAWEETASHKQYEERYTDRIVALIQQTLKAYPVPPNARVLVLPHNVNIYTWKAIERKLQNPAITVFTKGIEDHGHCYGSDAFLNLDLFEKESGDTPEHYLCVTAGVGGFFSALLLGKHANHDPKFKEHQHD